MMMMALAPSSLAHSCPTQTPILQQHQYQHEQQDDSKNTLSLSLLAERSTTTAHITQIHARLLRINPSNPVRLYNTLIRAYALHSYPRSALLLYAHLLPHADPFTLPFALKACSSSLLLTSCLHAHAIKLGHPAINTFFLNTLIHNYATTCARVDLAHHVFDCMIGRTAASWGALIAGYERVGEPHHSLHLFQAMRLQGEPPDEATLVSALCACAQLGCPRSGPLLHACTIIHGFDPADHVNLGTALIDMYAKCGCISYACKLFDRMPLGRRNVLLWSAMIGGMAMHGQAHEALILFEHMRSCGVVPNAITFTNVLNACSHRGLVGEGLRCFRRMMEEYRMLPRIEHYGCVVDMLGRAGLLEEALAFMRAMPIKPTVPLWRSLLGAACTHGDVELGEAAMDGLSRLEAALSASDCVVMSNLYAQVGDWEKVGKLRMAMNDSGLKKTPGFSVIEVDGTLHRFVMGDKFHPQTQHIYDMLHQLNELSRLVPIGG
ncbi:pentatricopeptide repeat-containing protein At4g21065 [Amborella trichopoda]|nr:pentatricopeptide repeat-containing protein At4g21065 [Amborella trichopoda]XP_020524583.1 pentatricopeptide repeat-containing protein At4g21065 [Amborella trichopoda]XP_020524584.1 pentatricopeptide repeat-containing protein At4g21065 [Amborella trichopoda]XP_020524585.1 pentatricopeptide repeat-containing protein At4g21065 [Amborella trichopoda]|eukprot:XP_006847225.2 pentatricopeptide repeat-containing protein At4g21065 [Amborella trichopoda]